MQVAAEANKHEKMINLLETNKHENVQIFVTRFENASLFGLLVGRLF